MQLLRSCLGGLVDRKVSIIVLGVSGGGGGGVPLKYHRKQVTTLLAPPTQRNYVLEFITFVNRLP